MGIHYGKADFINYGKPSLLLDFARNKSLVDRISGNNLITFERSSIGTYVGADGLIKTAAADEPRFDHNPVTGESLGLLIEGESNNYFTESQTMSNWTTLNADFETNTTETLAPDGTNTAHKLTATGSGEIQHRILLTTGTNNYNRTYFSVWLKTASGNGHFQMNIGNLVYPGNASTGYLAVYGSYVEEYPNGWYRFVVGRNFGSTSGGITLGVHLNANSGNGGYGFISTQSFEQSGEALYIWGPQWEVNNDVINMTSYIPTSGSTLTRQPDKASITGTNFSSWYNQSEGSFYTDIKLNSNFPVTDKASIPFTLSDSSYNNRITLASSTGSAAFNADVTISGTNYRAVIGNYTSGSNSIKSSIGYKSADTAGSLNGASPVTSSPSGSLPLLTRADIGKDHANFNYLSGRVRRITYYPERLTNTQLQELTQ